MKPSQTPSASLDWATLRTILVPTDFSDRADKALAQALDLARARGATIHLLYVIPPLEGDTYSPLRYTPEMTVLRERPDHIAHDKPDTIIHELLQSTLRRHDTDGVTVVLVERRGLRTTGAILTYARQAGVDLIVLSTHGSKGIRRLFLGSIAAEVVHAAPCAVLIVHEHEDDERRLAEVRRILVPVDFTATALPLLRQAKILADTYGASLDVLHVLESPSFLTPFAGIGTLYDLVPNLRPHAEQQMANLLAWTDGPDVPLRTHLLEGPPATTILDFAQAHGTDLIVISTHGLSGLRHFFLGSVTERVVRAAACPVLTVKTYEDAPPVSPADAVVAPASA